VITDFEEQMAASGVVGMHLQGVMGWLLFME